MPPVYYLSFRDIAAPSTVAVTPGEVYVQNMNAGFATWPGFKLGGADWVPWDHVKDVFRDKRVCFIVHGFNVPLMRGLQGEGPMAQQFEGLGGAILPNSADLVMQSADYVVPVVWAGDGVIGWNWFTAFGHAEATAQRFSEFLMSSAFTASEVSFVSHSLGARVVLGTVRRTPKPRFAFDTAVLMAAAIDDTALKDKEFEGIADRLRRIVVLSSPHDEVLRQAFTIGDAVESALWSDYDGDARALGLYGPALSPQDAAASKTEWYHIAPEKQQGHGDYFACGWDRTSVPNGWSGKRRSVAEFCRQAMDDVPFREVTAGWAQDRTRRFRPDWPGT